jgi:hypothetical protein
MVDCIGLAPGDFPRRTRELKIDRKENDRAKSAGQLSFRL